MEISPKAEAASCRLHKPMCVFRVAQGLLRATKETRRFRLVPAERFAGAWRRGDVRARNWAGEGGGSTVPLESTLAARVYELNVRELPRHTWERNLIFIRIDARAQHGALAGWLALQSPRPVSVQGPGLCNSTIFWPGERLQDCRRKQ